MNEFSIVCRVLGSLFYRQPQDPLLTPLMTLVKEGKLGQQWPLEQDALLTRMQTSLKAEGLDSVSADYLRLFAGEEPAVTPWRSGYEPTSPETDVREFLQQRGMSLGEGPSDHFGGLLLAASWLEDQAQEDEIEAQTALFDTYLLPWSDRFLGKVESHATTGFYRALAIVTREALEAMREELAETEEGEE